MDIYSQKSRWKLYLAIVGTIIVIVSVIYANYLSTQLAEEERRKTEIYAKVQVELSDLDDEDFENCEYELHLDILSSNTTIPVMVVNERGKVDYAVNFGRELEENEDYFQEELNQMIKQGFDPIEGFAYKVYFKESNILRQLRYFPLIQLLLIAAFVLFGYMGFNSARRAEQNRVWVGMAKETAHQLGTPISAIIAWIEHLKDIRSRDEEVTEVLGELQNDVSRLELIADRFSKIGSEPKLKSINIYEELEKCRAYMERRAPRKVKFFFPDTEHLPIPVRINPPLFDWVIENLLRNALDAMEGRGEIHATVTNEKNMVHIDIKDSGKGIPSNKFRAVFQPGFTTKKRGWGLGLSLAKRIIQEYHSGKIFVKDSVVKEGTTFRISLPK
jgi:signal transduction histidine kinase